MRDELSRLSADNINCSPNGGDQVVIVHHVWGLLRDGSRNEATVADVFTVEDGKVVLMMAYADPADAFR